MCSKWIPCKVSRITCSPNWLVILSVFRHKKLVFCMLFSMSADGPGNRKRTLLHSKTFNGGRSMILCRRSNLWLVGYFMQKMLRINRTGFFVILSSLLGDCGNKVYFLFSRGCERWWLNILYTNRKWLAQKKD